MIFMLCAVCWKILRPDNTSGYCKEHHKLNPVYRARQSENARVRMQGKFTDHNLVVKHGLDETALREILAKQGGLCRCCGKDLQELPRTQLEIDHDHKCCPAKKSCMLCRRGVVCHSCNMRTYTHESGRLRNPELIKMVETYLALPRLLM